MTAKSKRGRAFLRAAASAPATPEMQQQGWDRLRELVNAAVGDDLVQRSPDALMLAALLNDILHDCGPDDWVEEFDRKTRALLSQQRAMLRHDRQRLATIWPRKHFEAKRDEYHGKAEFARAYTPLVLDKFGVRVSERSLAERWLAGLK